MIIFRKPKNKLEGHSDLNSHETPAWVCPQCGKEEAAEPPRKVCHACGHHFKLTPRERLAAFANFTELFGSLVGSNPIDFPDYNVKLAKAQASTGETEGVVCGTGELGGVKTALFAMNPFFMMGSMGWAVGERVTLLFEHALANKLPVVGYCASGGARMQEGIISLMQMAKTSAAVKRHSDAGLLYTAVLTDPTTGGVTASFAMEADIILAEPGALVAFAGPRVVAQTTGHKLPKGFQRAEFLLEKGFIDAVVPREGLENTLRKLLTLHAGGKGI